VLLTKSQPTHVLQAKDYLREQLNTVETDVLTYV